MELDYQRDSQIDLDQLEIEWMRHVSMEERYIDQVSQLKIAFINAIEEEKLAHESLKSTRSKLLQECHANPERCIKKDKATGPEAEAYYRLHPDYLIKKRRWGKAEIRVMEAEEEWETAKAMKDLMHFTKTKALEQLVTLHGQGYFAGPETPRNVNMNEFKRDITSRKMVNRSAQIGSSLVVRRNG